MKLFLLFIFILNTTAWSMDLSQSYFSKKNKITSAEINALKKFKILIVPGVLAESFISSSDNQIKLNFLFEEAFKEQIQLMEEQGQDYEFLKVETENAPAENAKVIIEAIHRSDKPVLIYSHSKGGLDTLEAFRQDPGLISKVHGWASIQSPFWGATVASEFNKNPLLRFNSKKLFVWMGGSAAGMSSLSEEERIPYMNSNEVQNRILEIKQKIKFINYGSFKANQSGIDTPLEFFRNFTQIKAGDNDGVVPLNSALMKNHNLPIDFVLEPGVDHLMTMTKYRLDNVTYDQRSHTLAILALLL